MNGPPKPSDGKALMARIQAMSDEENWREMRLACFSEIEAMLDPDALSGGFAREELEQMLIENEINWRLTQTESDYARLPEPYETRVRDQLVKRSREPDGKDDSCQTKH